MKLNLALILSIIIAVGIVAFGFTYFQISNERERLNSELEEKVNLIAERFLERNLSAIEKKPDILNTDNTEKLLNQYRLLAITVYYNPDSILFIGPTANSLLQNSNDYILQAATADTTVGNYFKEGNRKIYQFIKPVKTNDPLDKTIICYSEADYIENIISSIWVRNFFRWFMQALLVSFITILVVRWGIFSPINNIVEWVKSARIGNLTELQSKPPAGFLAPLHKEITHIANAMREAKLSAEEEARLRANAESVWTPERLKVEMETLLQNKKLIVVSNREPYMHIHAGKEIKCIVPASGMITAMEPILKACGGLWIASGSGDADKETVDKNDKLQVPPEEHKYTLRRLWQTKEEEDHFYYGFSNEGLWPLCHIAHTRPLFRKDDWHYYKKVNQDFADAVIEETKDEEQPFILIQDYHFALLPEMIKKKKPKARVAIFWHIPWPNPESFGICPWQREILLGMLGADLIGFHTQYHCNHFLETVNNSLESRVLWENFTVRMGRHTTLVKPFPISIAFTPKDFDNHISTTTPSKLLAEHGITAQHFGIGVDRIDYTKGIIEKFLALERFFEKNPDYIGKFTFVQIGAPSRSLIKSYADMMSAVEKEAERINHSFRRRNWKPILFLRKHHSHAEIKPFYNLATLCMVTSLHDGMNLVAKEFVAERNKNTGVLILSRFAGASQNMKGALVINPYDIERTAEAIKLAIEMPESEQQLRMQLMRQEIVSNNIYNWAADLLRTMTSLT
ncbi:MAG: trehalose 6-phosphate synthase [Ignavibacteria bacterium]|nr:MAG: trehalose 6-phosphate synthase [Ignavibacteria bacterium]KAF0160497.1 MAG: trehalose 6-phosphate synthase [Ignavibacteria bacterium]